LPPTPRSPLFPYTTLFRSMRFDDALREVARQTVFTTHTPVPAGHDRFHGGLVEEHLGPLRDQLGISYEQLMGLGRVEPQNDQERSEEHTSELQSLRHLVCR